VLLLIFSYRHGVARVRPSGKDAIRDVRPRFIESFEFTLDLFSFLTHFTAYYSEISAILLEQGDESCYLLAGPSRRFPPTSNPLLFHATP
jgi:hypothetical protein